MFNVFPASSEHLRFGWPAGTGPWFPSSGKLLTKGPSENGSAIPMPVWCCSQHPRGTEEPEMMFPSLVDTIQHPKMQEGWFVLPPL